MPAFIDKMQLTVRDQFVEFLANKGRGDRIIVSPHQQGRLFDLTDLFTQIVANSAFRKRK